MNILVVVVIYASSARKMSGDNANSMGRRFSGLLELAFLASRSLFRSTPVAERGSIRCDASDGLGCRGYVVLYFLEVV